MAFARYFERVGGEFTFIESITNLGATLAPTLGFAIHAIVD